MCLGGPEKELQDYSTYLVFFLSLTRFPVTHVIHVVLCLMSFLSSTSLPFAPGPLLSHISSHNSSGKPSLDLTPHMWVHTSERSNNTEILQIRSCQIKGGISGAHPSLRRGSTESCLRPDLHVKIHLMVSTNITNGSKSSDAGEMWEVRCGYGEVLLAWGNPKFYLNCTKQALLSLICLQLPSFPSQILG